MMHLVNSFFVVVNKKSRLVNEMSVMNGLDERASDSKQMIKQRNLNEFQN